MSIKGRNYFANFQKLTIYNPSVDLVNDNVCSKFGLNNKAIRSQDIEQRLNSDVNQGPLLLMIEDRCTNNMHINSLIAISLS